MPALYRGLRLLLRGALELYFVDIQAKGTEHIPRHGPLIFAANHPNSIMDTMILGSQTHRTISYLARSGLFKNPVVAWVFNQCGVIPVYRAQDDPTQMTRNADSFRQAYALLESGGAIGIFPEGHNAPERAVGEIKTGVARIALGAEAGAAYGLGVKIIPVGLNFEDRDRFLSSVLIRFGAPIDVADWAEMHREDPQAASRDLTDAVLAGLRQEATHIDNDVVLGLTRDVYDVYGKKLLEEMIGDWSRTRSLSHKLMDEIRATPGNKQDLDDKFWIKQRIADAIAHFVETDPPLVDAMRKRVRAYKEHLTQVNLRHDFLERRPHSLSLRRESLKFTLYAFALAPVALIGLIGNIIPYMITRTVALRAPDEPIRAITGFFVGLLVFPLYFAALAYGLWTVSDHNIWLTLGVLLALPPTGFSYLRYRRQLARYRDKIILRTLFLNDRLLIQRLTVERLGIIASLATIKERFIKETGSEFDEHMASKEPT